MLSMLSPLNPTTTLARESPAPSLPPPPSPPASAPGGELRAARGGPGLLRGTAPLARGRGAADGPGPQPRGQSARKRRGDGGGGDQVPQQLVPTFTVSFSGGGEPY